MAYTLTNLQDDIRNYTEVDDSVLTTGVLNTMIKNSENKIYREADSDDNRFYATSNLASGSRYVTIPSDLRFIRYVQLTDASGNQTFLEKKDTSYMATFYDTPNTASGTPKYYGRFDVDNFIVAPTPDANYAIELHYYYKPTSLADSTILFTVPASASFEINETITGSTSSSTTTILTKANNTSMNVINVYPALSRNSYA